MTERFIREKERFKITGIPRSSWYVLQKENKAPKPISLGENRVAWLLSDLIEWQAECIAEHKRSAAA